ncbi:hypothetical protein HB364_17685 [Pseudoflavitalea sp. X16]|uniref:hypothetical protein n=1 Tax=Paraflavitalea devenefica TaxID=2716334 RepID=UPI0014249423|nr:hypothetical protein [Paraflavitalea devenefica]NII26926.1 hypothetical protein [Paraflavitalea devenefica]
MILLIGMSSLPQKVLSQELTTYRASQMQSDLHKFKHALEYAHPGLYTHNSPAEFNDFFNHLLAQTSAPLDAVQFHNIVLQLIAYLHDGHTRVFPANKLRAYINKQKLLPFHSLVQKQRIFITRNVIGKDMADGSEIIAINGVSSDKIIVTLQRYFAGDGLCGSCLEYRFGTSYNSFYRIFPLIFGFHTVYELTIKDYKTNKISSIEVPAVSVGEFRTNEKAKYGNNLHTVSIEETMAEPAFKLDFGSDNRYALMKISRFVKDGFEEPANSFPDMYTVAFRQIKERGNLLS